MGKKSRESEKTFSFEQAMARLEAIVSGLESGELSLEDSLQKFEEGVGLVKECRGFLEKSRQRVEVLLGDEAGRPVVEVFEEDVDDPDPEE